MAASASYTNLLAFLLTLLFYYLALKPSPSVATLKDPQLQDAHTTASYKYLGIFFMATLLIQFVINIAVISAKCGGAITQNMAYSGFITFIPWTLIFGAMIAVLAIWGSFRKIFADVFGYYFVASSATKILTELLVNKDIQTQIDADRDPAITAEDRVKMQNAADMIVKICGNTSVLINQITPDNFMEYWGLLTPLMKSRYAAGGAAADELQSKLFDLIVTKDNVGEATWFIYTGILIVSLVQMKIAARGCINNAAQQQANYADFLAQEKAAADARATAQGTVYTLS